MITNIMKQKMLSAVKNTKRVELLGASNEVLSSKEVSWNTSTPTQSYVTLEPVSIASGADNVPEKVRLVTGTAVDFENRLSYSGDINDVAVYEPYMENIISKNYPIGTIVEQAYQRGNVVYPFRLYKASHVYSDLLGISIFQTPITLEGWHESDIELLYNRINDIQYIDERNVLHKIDDGQGILYYVSTPAVYAFGVKDKSMAMTYNISDYTSSQLNYPEGVQIDINSLREEL